MALTVPLLVFGSLLATQGPPEDAKIEDFHKTSSVTKHSITLGGSRIDYTATAGHIPIRNDAGELMGQMFYVAYTKDGADAGSRPVTFAFNGGPGSASLWLHLGTLGPKRTPMNDDGSLPKPPYAVVENQDSWLGATDVVMIDAMGTGYSRVAKPEHGKYFYGMRPDINAFGDFVYGFLREFKRFRSPLFVAGESYGGIRGPGLSLNLLDRGIALNGLIVISGTMNFQTLDSARGNDLPYISFLPTFSATAWYHKKLSPKYQGMTIEALNKEAEIFAEGDYANALQRGSSLNEAETARVAKRLSELTGLKESFVRQSNLRVSEFRFFKELLREEGKTTGRYDSRLTGTDALAVGDGPDYDASDAAVSPVFYSCINDYLTNELGYKTALKYRMWNTDDTNWEFGDGYADSSDPLRRAMARNPHMKVLFTCGWFDLACPHFGARYSVNHMDLRPDQMANISWQYYPAGHMMYIEKASRQKLARDVNAFISGAR